MSDSTQEKSTKNAKPTGNLSGLGRGAIAIIALIVVLVIVALVNYAANSASWRMDLTEDKIYTLSDGTKGILKDLDTPVSVRYFVTDGEKMMSPRERAQVKRTEELLRTYVANAPTKPVETLNEETGDFEEKKVRLLSVEKFNPEPNTDAEDMARAAKVAPYRSPNSRDPIYNGIEIRCVEKTEVIPLQTVSEARLEYELTRAIANTHGGDRRTLRILSGLSLGGGPSMNFQAPPSQAWAFFGELEKDYQVEMMQPMETEIPDDTDALLVIHPTGLSPETQFAIDQYLLAGGKLAVVVDPNFFHDQLAGGAPPQQFQGPSPGSDLPTLFNAWGVKYQPDQVLMDRSFGARWGREIPTLLDLGRESMQSQVEIAVAESGAEALRMVLEERKKQIDEVAAEQGVSEEHIAELRAEVESLEKELADIEAGRGKDTYQITRQITSLNLVTPGAFDVPESTDELAVIPLVQSSPNNQLIPAATASPREESNITTMIENFEAHGKQRAFVLQLTGNFKTAFPDGDPSSPTEPETETEADNPDEAKPEAADEAKPEALKTSKRPSTVVLFSDLDFLYIEGIQRIGLRNQNLALFQNVIETLAGDERFVKLRSRDTGRRPFTKVNEWYAEIAKEFKPKLDAINEQARAVSEEIGELTANNEAGEPIPLTRELMAKLVELQETEAEYNMEIRDLDREQDKAYKKKLASYKFLNTAVTPVIVIILGIGIALARRLKTAAR